MNKLKYLFIHCSATREGQDVRPDDIRRIHMAPRLNADGTLTYLGRRYSGPTALPNEFIGGQSIRFARGNGWDRPGYRAFITLDGVIHRLRDANTNDIVEPGEVTWGVGPDYNGISHHVCYAGGMDSGFVNIKDTRTKAQREALLSIIDFYLNIAPDIQIIGHNQVANKGCPSFSVPKWLNAKGIPAKNIATEDKFGHARNLNG